MKNKFKSLLILILILSISGCAGSIAIKRNQYHKLFPEAQQKYADMNKQTAIKTFQEVSDKCIQEYRQPDNMIKTPDVNDEGLSISIATYKIHLTSKYYTFFKPTHSYHEERLSDEHNTMKWINVSKIKVSPIYNETFGKWIISVVGKWEEKSKFCCQDFSFRVRTDEERDKAIASLLRLCPQIK